MPTFETCLGTMTFRDEGTGPPLLLIHSLGTSNELWRDVIDRMSADYRIIAPDVLGHGRSAKPSRELTIPDHADLLAALMTSLGIERFAVAGTSLGGLLTLELGARYARRVTAIVCNGAPGWHLESQRLARLISTSRMVGPDGNPKPDTVPGGTVRQPTPEQLASRKRDLADVGRWFMSTMWAIASYDPIARLPAVRCPVMVMMGDGDFHLATSYTLLDGLVDGRLHVLPNAGHLSPYDDPHGVADTMHEFFRSVHREQERVVA